MKIGIIGAGAIGCTIGARLALGARALGQTETQILLVGRPWVAERLSKGMRLSRWGEDAIAFPSSGLSAHTDLSIATECDIVFVCTKSKDTREIAASLSTRLAPRVPVGSLQNGVRNAATLAELLPGHPIWPAMVPFNVVWLDEGQRLHQGTSGPVVLPKEARSVAELLRAGGAPAITRGDVEAVQWGKLLLNLNNAINALSGLPLRQMLSDREYRRILAAVITEGRSVLSAAQIRASGVGRIQPSLVPFVLRLPDILFFRIASAMIHVDPLARSSMADDLARGRATEVDDLNGEIVALAQRHTRAAPLNASLVRLVHEAEQKGIRPQTAQALWEAMTQQ